MKKIKSYDDWLSMSDDEKDQTKASWNAYEREFIGIPLVAAGRLALTSHVRVLDGRVGTHHGGEYILRMVVNDKDLPTLPEPYEQKFEGFRVTWDPASIY